MDMWLPGGCCCAGGCHIATLQFDADGEGGLIGWTLHAGSVSVNEDGSITLAPNTRVVLDAMPAGVSFGDHAVVSFDAVGDVLRIGHPIGDGVRGEFFDVSESEISLLRVVYSTSLHNPNSVSVSEYPVSTLLRTEEIDASAGGSFAVAMADGGMRGKFAATGSSPRDSGGQSVFAHNYRLLPTVDVLTATDPRPNASLSSEAWPGEDFENAQTEDFVPPAAPSASVSNQLLLQSGSESETITGVQFEKASCFGYKYWGGGFRETSSTWTFAPTIDFDTGGVHALVNGAFLSSYFIDIVQFGDDSTYLLNYNRGGSWSTSDVVVYDQSSGRYIDAYWDSEEWERVVRVNGFVGLDPSGEYDLAAISRNSTTDGGSTGNGAATVYTYNVPVSGNGYSKSMPTSVLIWYRADLDETLIRVRMYLAYSAIPGSARHEWTFQKVVPGVLTEESSSHTLEIISAGVIPFEWTAAGGYTGGVVYDAGSNSYVLRAGRMRPNGSATYEDVPTGGKRGGTCTIAW